MPSVIDLFNQNVVGSKGFISDFLPVISSSGDFTRVTELSVIISSWNNVLLTPLRTYAYDPDYGSELYKYVFDQNDEETVDDIKDEVRYRLTKFDDRAVITNIEVIFMKDGKGFIVNIDFMFNEEETRMKVNIDGNVYIRFLE
jgi:phage baseplate assembly protein W